MDFGTLWLLRLSFQEALVSAALVVLHMDGCICLEKMDGEAFVIQVILSLIDKNIRIPLQSHFRDCLERLDISMRQFSPSPTPSKSSLRNSFTKLK